MIAILHSYKLRSRRLGEASLGEIPESRYHDYKILEKAEGEDRLSVLWQFHFGILYSF
jgi:hypothetical protein